MPTIVRFNRFPGGNLGGLLVRKEHPDSRNAMIALFMPPLKQQEVLLNIPKMPKKAYLDTDEMRPVLSMEGSGVASRWKLRIASRDSSGQNVWSPFTFANVWQDARICWGSGNTVPTTFARAWTDFWTAPFNRDLAADVPIREYSWWYDNHHVKEEKKSWPPRSVRMVERPGQNTPPSERLDPQRWLADNDTRNAAAEAISRLRESLDRFEGIRRELARRGRENCANRGVAFVAINHKAYMRALKITTDLKLRHDAAILRFQSMESAGPNLAHAINQHAQDFAARLYRYHKDGERLWGDRPDEPREYHKYYWGRVEHALKTFRTYYRGRDILIRRYWRWRIRCAMIDCFRAEDERATMDLYRNWQQDQLANGLMRHFCSNEWTKTLVFRPIQNDLTPWGVGRPFPPCDGVFSIPAKMCTLPLPGYEDVFTVHNLKGQAFWLNGPAKMALFRNVSDKVKFLFVPGSENVYLTNGVRVEPVDDSTFASVLAELEAQEIDKIDAAAMLERAGFCLERVESLDLTRREREDPEHERADDDDAGPDDEEPEEEEEPEEHEETDEERMERELEDFRDHIPRHCDCTVCRNRCACGECYAETAEHEDEDGHTIPDCECAACQWISDNHELGRVH